MTQRKLPVRLARGAFSGRVEAWTNYRALTGKREGILQAATNGKHDVTADYDRLVLEELIPDSKDDIVANLDGAARGMELTGAERKDIADFRARLVTIIERHNARG